MKSRAPRIFPPTSESLNAAALAYLARFAASEFALRRVLENRIRRASIHNSEFRQDRDAQTELRHVIEKIIEKHKKTGALNDAAYAANKVSSLRRGGRSARAIALRLGRAGVKKEIIADALTGNDEGANPEDMELKAAREWARRRKLGPFRPGGTIDPERHRKDMAILARAGFALGIARQVLANQWPGEKNDEDAVGDWSGG